jgi:hypothetical protein
VYDENLFRLKEDIINNRVVWNFTIYAGIGLLIQIIYNDILANEIPDRVYDTSVYWIALFVSIGIIGSLVPGIKSMSRWAVKGKWQKEIAIKAKEAYSTAKQLAAENKGEAESKRAIEIANWLEELFEMKSHRQDIESRLEFFEPFFK